LEARAQAKYIREAPRKTRLVIDLIRGKNAAEAAVILQFTPRAAAKTVLKVLNSAVANAVQKGAAGAEGLTVTEAFVNEGPTLKRFKPRARGSASRINKRSSHITIIVAGDEKTVKPAAAKAAAAKEKASKKAEVASSPKTEASRNDATAAKTEKTKEAKPSAKKPAAKKAPKKEGTSGSES
jgi:large subunit ribosomal protein L22